MKQFFIIIVICLAQGNAFAAPSFPAIKASYQASDAVLLDRHGEVIHELRIDLHARKLEWVTLPDISPALVKAVIRSEDKRFYDHHGADWQALASAAVGSVLGSGRRGASTITMQLASFLDNKLKKKSPQRTVGQKWEQIKTAQEIEKTWTKDQILEAYFNLVSFRGELQGIAAASRGLFDKNPNGLDEVESAILAVLIRAPNAAPEKAGERAVSLAALLGSTIPQEKIQQRAVAVLSRPYAVRKKIDLAPHMARMLLHERNTKATSTLDIRLQRFTGEILRQAIMHLANQNVQDGAALIVDNRSGDVLAYVGNVGKSSSAGYVDGIQAHRQAGSTLKPFLYGLAIEKKIITAASLIEDTPLDVPTERGVYRPENYDKKFKGLVSARTALASSLNIPAVRTAGLVSVNAFAAKLYEFGFSNLKDPLDYGPSLALGTADVTLWELVNAYRALANNGVWSKLRNSHEEKTGVRKRVLSPEAAFIVSSILSDREARSATFSLESPLGTRFWTAVKTGTSKDMRDNWCIGYSEQYTVGVWVGNFSGASMWNVSGVSGAAPVWLEIMNYLHHAATSHEPALPQKIIVKPVRIESEGLITTKREYFIAGTETDALHPTTTDANPKITYPAPNMIIAIDPDIPPDLQRVYFKISTSDPLFSLKIDEITLGSAADGSWKPSPGTHQLYLIAPTGTIADQISFEVR